MSQQVKTISVEELKQLMDNDHEFQLIDVREQDEKAYADIGGELIPMRTILSRLDSINRDTKVIVYCRSGNRSGRVIAELQRQFGFDNLYNLAGGILAWSDKIDPKVKKY